MEKDDHQEPYRFTYIDNKMQLTPEYSINCRISSERQNILGHYNLLITMFKIITNHKSYIKKEQAN